MKRLEQFAYFRGAQAYAGIPHFKTDNKVIGSLFLHDREHGDFALFGKLDCIAGVVEQHLGQAQRIAAQRSVQSGILDKA